MSKPLHFRVAAVLLLAVIAGASGIVVSIVPQAVAPTFKQGSTGTKFLIATGTFTSGNLIMSDASGNAVDGGVVDGGAVWSLLTSPTGNLSLTMGAKTSTFTFNGATGSANLFTFTDTASNTGTGRLGYFTTASGSTLLPIQFDANGSGFQETAAGIFNYVPTGTSQTQGNGSDGSQVRIYVGTNAAPVTTAGSVMKLSKTENLSKVQCHNNIFETECNATLVVEAFNVVGSGDMNIQAIHAGATTISTTAGTDAFALTASGRVLGSGVGIGGGAYIEGIRETTTGTTNGLEVRVTNVTSSNCTVSTSSIGTCDAIWITPLGDGVNQRTVSSAVHVGAPFSTGQFLEGLTINSGSVTSKSFNDASSSTTSINIGGTHTTAILTGTSAGKVGFNTTATDVGAIGSELSIGGSTSGGLEFQNTGSARTSGTIGYITVANGSTARLGEFEFNADGAINSGSFDIALKNAGSLTTRFAIDHTGLATLTGTLKFAGTNSTGAGTALLGSNSPAITLTAPYTWVTVQTSDGSTGFIPVWK